MQVHSFDGESFGQASPSPLLFQAFSPSRKFLASLHACDTRADAASHCLGVSRGTWAWRASTTSSSRTPATPCAAPSACPWCVPFRHKPGHEEFSGASIAMPNGQCTVHQGGRGGRVILVPIRSMQPQHAVHCRSVMQGVVPARRPLSFPRVCPCLSFCAHAWGRALYADAPQYVQGRPIEDASR